MRKFITDKDGEIVGINLTGKAWIKNLKYDLFIFIVKIFPIMKIFIYKNRFK